MKEIKVGVVGCLGKMGRLLVNELTNNKRVKLVGAFARSKIDKEFRFFKKVKIIDSLRDLFKISDVVIDFSSKECTLQCLEAAIEFRKPFVSGTTGIEDIDLRKYATKTPILWSANMSTGINVLLKIVKKAAELLSDEYDAEIWEMHHNLKKDSPSGTARELGKTIAEAFKCEFSINQYLHNSSDIRKSKSIGFAVSRGGGVIGDHKVMFVNSGERIELSHQAINREIFAKGAVKAAIWLYDNKRETTGLYSIQEVI